LRYRVLFFSWKKQASLDGLFSLHEAYGFETIPRALCGRIAA
jgi:hypothetical protein